VSAVGSAVSGVDHVVTGAVGQVGETAAAVATPVVQAAPAPVQQAVAAAAAPVVTPVASAVQAVADSAPVAQVVAPVAAAADQIVSTVPAAYDLLGDAPIGTVTTPVSGLVDHTVEAVVDPATDAIDPVTGVPASPILGLGPTLAPSLGAVDSIIGSFVTASVSAAVTQFSARSADGMSLALIIDGALGARQGVGSPSSAPGAPPTPGGQSPFDQLAVTSGTASSAGPGAAGANVALTEKGFSFSAADFGDHTRAADDDVPSSPVADHDISPD
jgi:hypothetical protein